MGLPAHIPLTLGTAGHVDHGKTKLVEALTGVNTDRLAEERRRGLSIELGFAELDLGDGRSVGVVDVPGHERFVRAMVAGATGIDMFLLAVAADEGVMPQTREHLAVLEALEVRHGVIAVTKCDRAEDDALAMARDEAQAVLPAAPLTEVSAVTGVGLDELRVRLAEVASAVEDERVNRDSDAGEPVVLHVDRSFTLHGIGTVVTGTLWSGSISPGDPVEILPRGTDARARRVQVHNRDVDRARPGQRVALNLSGAGPHAVARGDVITSADSDLRPSYRLDVHLRVVDAAEVDGRRVQVHHGTRAVPARAMGLGDGLVQLRLEAPLVARSGDRLVLRGIAPVRTIGGGAVLDPAPRRHGPRSNAHDRLNAIRERGLDAVLAEERRRRAEAGRSDRSRRCLVSEVDRLRPLDDREKLLLALLQSGDAEPDPPRALAERVGIEPKSAVAGLDRLVERGEAVRVAADLYYAAGPLERLEAETLELAQARGEITLAELRDALGTSRKYAQALLEHLDATKKTIRHGDRHVPRRAR
jgi:selenocysteine-specific elongation factor